MSEIGKEENLSSVMIDEEGSNFSGVQPLVHSEAAISAELLQTDKDVTNSASDLHHKQFADESYEDDEFESVSPLENSEISFM
jgi:hypothetical protein